MAEADNGPEQKSAGLRYLVVEVVRVVLVVVEGRICSLDEAINHRHCGHDATK